MPSGIILSSGSQGATQEAIEKVLTANGYEPDQPPVTTEEPVEPKRDDFDSDDAFEAAQEDFHAKQEEAEAAEEEKREKEEENKTAKPSRRQRAVEKATKELRDQLKQANDRLAALEGKNTRTEVAKAPKAPKREDFATDEEFADAQFDYRYQLRRAKEQVTEAQKAVTDRLKTNFENYQGQVAAFKEKHDDWDEVVNQPIAIHESVFLAVQEQENGAAVTYYLGKHPDYAKKLADMSPLSAVMEVGRLAERLKTGAAKPAAAGNGATQRRAPKLPEPVKPVSTSATSSTLSSREAAQQRNYRAFRTAQRRGA